METGLLTPKKKGMIPLKEQLDNIQKQALAEIQNASDIKSVDDLKIRLLGKKGELTAILKQMGKLSAEERPVIGQLANEVRQVIETDIARRREQLKSLDTERRLKKEVIDVTLPGKRMEQGGRHPLNIVLDRKSVV